MTKFKIGDEIGMTYDPSWRGIVIGFIDNETYYKVQRNDGTIHWIPSYDIAKYYSLVSDLYVAPVVLPITSQRPKLMPVVAVPYVPPVPEKNLLWIAGIIILFIFMMRS